MEFLLELVGEIFLEGIVEIIKNKGISKWIRYPLFILLSIVYLLLILAFGLITIQLFFNQKYLGGFLILLLLLIFFYFIIRFFKKILE